MKNYTSALTKYRTFLLAILGLCAHASAATSGPGEFEKRLFPPPMDALYQNRLQAECAEYLSINLFDVPIDHSRAAEPGRFIIVSPDNEAYAAQQKVAALVSSSRTRAIRVALRKDLLVKATCIFLKLPKPMLNGKTYQVQVGDIGPQIPALPPLVFDDRRQTNDNIRVNQLGYLPGYAKYAYLGQYVGKPGGMAFAAKQFELLDADGKSVFTGQVKRRGVGDELVGQTVYELDFTAFDKGGTYRVHVPGVGLSYPFDIGPAAWTPAYVNLMRGNYHQRCGMDIDNEYTRHARPACHLDDAWLEQAVEKLKFVNPKNPLYPTKYDEKKHPAVRGHHDAGDYGKYTTSGCGYVLSILAAYDAFGDKFQEDNLRLPYSGNGIPDLLEECKWELDWLQNMQDEDGGVFGVIKPNTGGYEHYMPPAEAHRLFYPKDTVFTAAYAAALAHAARSPMMRKYYAQDCDRYLAKAKKAWEWLEKNKTYVHYFHYGSTFEDWDELCWAAVELYATTGQDKYHQYFLKNFDPGRKHWGWWPLLEGVGYATECYLFLKDLAKDAAMEAKCKTALREACDKYMKDADAFPYRMSMPGDSIKHGTYGWYFPASMFGYHLLMGYALDGKKEYLQCALNNFSYEMGTNAFGYFLQTGLGQKRNIELVSDVSTSDGITEPVPGLPLGIGTPGFYWLAKYGKAVGEGTYPDDWPLMNRWYDGFNVQSEYTSPELVRETIVAGFFASLGKERKERPTVKVKASSLTGPAPLKVQFQADAKVEAGRIRQCFWDFGDESFSTQRSPTHVFDSAGKQYTVCVTVIDDEGGSAYDVVKVYCAPEKPAYPQKEFEPDEHTLLLYHLNGDLKDSSGNGLDLSAVDGNVNRTRFSFSREAPLWMKSPEGSCLQLDGEEHFTVTVPAQKLPDPAATPLTLEMMSYLDDFAGWGYPSNPICLGVQNRYDSWLGWKQDKWDKSQAPVFGGGSGVFVTSGRLAKELPRERWCHVKIAYDGKDTARFFIDGKCLGEGKGRIFRPEKTALVFTLGPFRGLVDEVRLSKTVRN